MKEQIHRCLDIADYILCRFGPLSFPSWQDFIASNARKLYAGKLRRALPQFATHFGITPFYASTRNINQDVTAPFQIPDGSVEVFQSEDVFEHIEFTKMVPLFNEIHRVLVPGGLFRLSLPDYHCEETIRRCLRGPDGEILFDPGGEGQFVDGRVIGGGHVWFPKIEIVRDLFDASLFAAHGDVRFLQYNNGDGTFKLDAIDYSLGYIQRTPDHDARTKDRPRPISIVVDARKV
ncbi:MAG TPA: methyltransferase domain-containing protein [Steroidobacteraceae bacterium]|jgi:SAM-dependent methyltransferase|nr:methyltransferase domain-containing protein [Steroidobacteraceae bacterium]